MTLAAIDWIVLGLAGVLAVVFLTLLIREIVLACREWREINKINRDRK